MRPMLLTIALCALVSPAFAADIAPLPETTPAPAELVHKTCQVGNQNATHFVGDLAFNNKVAILVDPTAQCGCPVGVDLQDMVVKIQSGFDCDVDLVARLRSPLPESFGTGCLEPGKIECETGVITRKLTTGLNTESLKFDCACADSNFPYFLEFEAVGNDCVDNSDGSIGFALTQEGDRCDSYLKGVPASDLTNGPTYFSIWAETVCCNKPVDTENESFGEVKSRFED